MSRFVPLLTIGAVSLSEVTNGCLVVVGPQCTIFCAVKVVGNSRLFEAADDDKLGEGRASCLQYPSPEHVDGLPLYFLSWARVVTPLGHLLCLQLPHVVFERIVDVEWLQCGGQATRNHGNVCAHLLHSVLDALFEIAMEIVHGEQRRQKQSPWALYPNCLDPVSTVNSADIQPFS